MLSSVLQTFPVLTVAEHSHPHNHPHASPESPSVTTSQSTSVEEVSPTKKIVIPGQSAPTSSDAAYSYYGHPAATRASLRDVAYEIAQANSPSAINSYVHQGPDIPEYNHSRGSNLTGDEILPPSEETPLLGDLEGHAPPKSHPNSHGGSMNVRALVLHVLGDALGNVGVIATGFVIWQTSWSFKYYFDPLISLVITVIIFSSALPLGKYWQVLWVPNIHLLGCMGSP